MTAATEAPDAPHGSLHRIPAAINYLSRLPRGFLGVKLALTQHVHRAPSVDTDTLVQGASMAGHDGLLDLPRRNRTSAPGTPEDLHRLPRTAIYNADRGIGEQDLGDRDADTPAALEGFYYTAAQRVPVMRWHPNKLDAAMAMASIGIGILSGLTAGSITWWATGEHPHLLNLRGHLHLGGH
ncbi:hypothetical protein [Mycobacteroides abscessus]|uniref:hypothetical protein n=1 Tax=Mycobacteroides abscessus TaxID=36809 RepID=UPI0009A90559|nr:hypothetical protein [Mycobacteroides abscessus]SLF48642.1 Uncharacterised protein [Mycobacteroides abscessus subsp. abscessus]